MIRFNAKNFAAVALLGFASVAAQADGSTVLEVAKGKGNFTTLAKAIEVAGLNDALNGNGPVTIFAPTDEAFAKL
ncbi:MAG: fasciclin domain-containing protein, partial [Proteobacteria bacterium]|nr:fasciclin domain-containing protein [Pseudomonadota bacterium]